MQQGTKSQPVDLIHYQYGLQPDASLQQSKIFVGLFPMRRRVIPIPSTVIRTLSVPILKLEISSSFHWIPMLFRISFLWLFSTLHKLLNRMRCPFG